MVSNGSQTGSGARNDIRADLKSIKGVSERDRRMLEEAETLLGPEPASMGVMKNYFWGRVRDDLLLPFPDPLADKPEERAACDALLEELGRYLKDEHPATLIDQEQHIPEWVIRRLFEMGVLGCTIPKEYGGLGFGITSYNRVLELIGRHCGSTAVVVSAHQSIGCKAVMLFGTDEQKRAWLPKLATDWLSAFCLSEPNVGCDAGGQETTIELAEDGEHYIVKGEKKWATSGAISGLFTVMGKQTMPDGKRRVTAVVCTPDMPGLEIFSQNRSKCGIRGTWQARIRFNNVRVPRWRLLHEEGKGLSVALSCLNYGRCTLSAGMLGGAKRAMDQALVWARARHQFQRPLADLELVKQMIARMSALVYGMESVLYATTGFLDRGDADIMVETAACKTFCSEMGWRAVNDALQVMGGEGYMTENEIERIFRDSRINTIVEGANEVMKAYIFGYGGKQLAEKMLGLKERAERLRLDANVIRAGVPLATEVFLGVRRHADRLDEKVTPELVGPARRLAGLVSELTYRFKRASQKHDATIVTRQAVQARIADAALWIHAWACSLSRLDRDLRSSPAEPGPALRRDLAAAEHLFDLAELEIRRCFSELEENADASMLRAADAAIAFSETQDPSDLVIPERTPTDLAGKGRTPRQDAIKQFPGASKGYVAGGTGREHTA